MNVGIATINKVNHAVCKNTSNIYIVKRQKFYDKKTTIKCSTEIQIGSLVSHNKELRKTPLSKGLFIWRW